MPQSIYVWWIFLQVCNSSKSFESSFQKQEIFNFLYYQLGYFLGDYFSDLSILINSSAINYQFYREKGIIKSMSHAFGVNNNYKEVDTSSNKIHIATLRRSWVIEFCCFERKEGIYQTSIATVFYTFPGLMCPKKSNGILWELL